MKTIATAIAAACLALAGHAQALREVTPQQQLTTTCHYEADARELKGRDKDRFFTDCLAAGRRREQEVLAQCRLESRSKPALQRRAFMNECSRR